jgi:hypothetical protein
MKCDYCDQPFIPAKPWQRFCCAKHRDAFHNREKLGAAYRAKVEEAEDRLNGRSATIPTDVNLAALGLAMPKAEEPMKRTRRFS